VQLGRYFTQQALVFQIHPHEAPDSTRLAPGMLGVPLDVPRSDSLAWHVYRYARLFDADTLALDPTAENITTNLSYPFYSLGQAYMIRGQRERSVQSLRRAFHLAPIPQLAALIDTGLPRDTVSAEELVPEDSVPR
jgi:hypothetical protein